MHRFRVDAILDPQSLLRVTGYFAQRSIVPTQMKMQVRREHMRIDVTVEGLAPLQAAALAARLREVVAVIDAGIEDLAA